ncbi:MAG TPA: BON domain-containing protein [Usitatibacter sp.]|nr:BON domain-containing protein [Usitatibacter sp.]
MQSHFRPPRAPGIPQRAFDVLLGLVLGAVLAYLLDHAIAASRRREREEPVEDPLLLGRVRLALSQTIADPRAVEVRVHDGTVILKGPATGEQIAEMITCARRVRGVRRVENRLSPIG